MGSISRVFKKVTRAVKKPISKAFKGVAKGIMKVGKATMRGVAKLNKKLGPLGSIALSIAMPYALSGLSTAIGTAGVPQLGIKATGMMGSENLFIRSIGNIGNAIRTGYSQATMKVGKAFDSITNSIKKGFSNLGKGNNIFSRISNGAKRLFNQSKATLKKYSPKPFKGTQGTVQVSDMGYGFGETTSMTSAQASKALELGQISGEQLSGQTLGKSGWFTQGSSKADEIITNNINDAFKSKLDTYSPDMKRYFNDKINYEKKLGTYVNDAITGMDAEKALGVTKNYATDFSTTPYNIDIDLMKTGDYTLGSARDRVSGSLNFTGNSSYNSPVVKDAVKESNKLLSAAKKTAISKVKGLLTSDAKTEDISPYYMGNQDMTMNTTLGGYTGTDIQGAGGGSLLEGVFSDAERQRIMTYYKNMNIIGSS